MFHLGLLLLLLHLSFPFFFFKFFPPNFTLFLCQRKQVQKMCPSFKPMEILNSYQNFYHTVKNFASCTDDFVPVMNVITISEKGQSPMSSFWFLIACNLLYLFKCFLFYLHCLVDKNLILTLLKFP